MTISKHCLTWENYAKIMIEYAHHCGTCIPLSDDKHQFVQDSSKSALEIQDNVQNKFFLTKFFSLTEFCLGLDFVSDYIP